MLNVEQLKNLNNFILILILVVNFGLAVYFYSKGRNKLVVKTIIAMLLSLSFWTFALLLYHSNRQVEWALFYRRIMPIGAAFLISYFVYFCQVFAGKDQELTFWGKTAILLPSGLFSLFSLFSDLMIRQIIITDPNNIYQGQMIYGPLYRVYAVFLVSYFCYGVFLLFKKYWRAEGRERLQLFYILFGMAVSGGFGFSAVLILPLLGIPQFFTGGPVFSLLLAGFMTYAIASAKLLNIEDFLSRGTLLLAIVAALIGTVYCFFNGLAGYLPLYYIVITLLAIGTVVFSYNRRNKINLTFALMAAAMASIVFSYAILFNAPPSALALVGARGIYASASILVLLLFYFSGFFPFEKEKLGWPRQILAAIMVISFAIAAFFTRLVVVDVLPDRQIVFGQLFPGFILFSLFFAGYSLGLLLKKMGEASTLQQKQIKYIIVGLLVFGAPIFMADVVSPLIFHNYRFMGPAFYLIIPGAGLMAYAIMRHRLMTVEVAIQHSAVYALSTMMLMAIYALAVMVSEIYLRKMIGYSSQVVAAVIVVVIAIMYQPLVHGFQNFTDRLFFKGRYDYRKTLRKISQEIASVIKLEQLAKLIALSFVNTMKISEISFLLREKDEEKYFSVPLNVPRYQKIEISVKSPIVQWLAAAKDILVLDEIEDEITRQEALGREGLARKAYLEEVAEEIERLGIALWVPIIAKGELTGILAMGNKLSGDVFTSEDLALLNTLSNQTAVALENARLYEEVLAMKNYNEEILQSMTNGVLTTDSKGKLITFNFMVENITGRKAGEVIGKKCEEVWGSRGAITGVIARTLRGEPCLNFETGIASAQRGLVPVSFSTTLLKDGQGKHLGALLSINDLSGLKELEYKIRRADKLTALATMAAGMAHEIKNPLSSMKVFAQLLPKKIDDQEYRKKLEEILPKEIDRIDKIVENLLGFARSTTPTFNLTGIEEVLEENIKYFEEKARNSGITIKQDYRPLPEIEIDRGQISQVFSNLILNAIQAMPEGGEIVVATFPGKKTDGILQDIKIRVSDTGHGISAEIQKKLFDPFFTTKYGGTGLGLAISHSIVDGHKGSIDLESQVGKGTSFTVTLPLHQ